VSYPLHLDVTGRRVLVVGAGPVAVRRVRNLIDAGADVDVVALDVADEMPAVPLQRRAFRPDDVDGAWLVHACTGVVDADIAAACEARRVWCVRADDALQSRAWVPAVARADDVVVSVTGGRDPRRAMALRDAIALGLDDGSLPMRRYRADRQRP
jgi:uroporphyrin-III C-methyltransferase / precorrin-2 dehydrogenase / sirohydrochlorin ferrochelatase